MVNLFLIRHGECSGKGLYIGGGTDVPLIEDGIKQIEGLRQILKLQNIVFEKIYSSSLIRARQSSQILEEYSPEKTEVLSGLEESNFGRWEGLAYDDINSREGEALTKWIGNPYEVRPPEGENLQDVEKRVFTAAQKWESLINDSETHQIAVVSHRGPLALLLLKYLSLGPDYFWSFKLDRGSVSRVNLYPGHSELAYLNLTAVP